jgi:uncharacterized protein YdeI (YjbR/CyaY-like superfamily)
MNQYYFTSKVLFREWLSLNVNHEGIWLIFEKGKDAKTLTPQEALDVALCFGWIDGVIKRIDDLKYIKYFAKRRPQSVWSTKNKKSVDELITKGEMTNYGYQAIEVSKKNSRYQQGDQEPFDFSIEDFKKKLKDEHSALGHYEKMSSSVQKIYALYYFSAKKEETRNKRLVEIILRLNKNLKLY